jgi:SET domain-containing protein
LEKKTFILDMSNYRIDKSNINGQGVIATEKINKDEIVDVAIYFYYFFPVITEHIGKYVNHQKDNNCELHYENKRYFFKTCKDIYPEEELTMDYNKTPWYIMKSMPWYSEIDYYTPAEDEFKTMEGSGYQSEEKMNEIEEKMNEKMNEIEEKMNEIEESKPEQTLKEFMDML